MLGANPLPGNLDLAGEFNDTENTTSLKVDEDYFFTSTPMPQVVINNGSSLLINGTMNGTSDEEFVCAFYNPDFIIYSSLGSFYIPCFIMIFLYIRIFSVSYRQCSFAQSEPGILIAM